VQTLYLKNARALVERAASWLTQDVHGNNLILGVALRAAEQAREAYGWIVEDRNETKIAAFRTPPHALLVSAGAPNAAKAMASFIEIALPGATGPVREIEAFSQSWRQKNHLASERRTDMTFYTCAELQPAADPGGALLKADVSQLDELVTLNIAAAKAMLLPPTEQHPDEIRVDTERTMPKDGNFFGPKARQYCLWRGTHMALKIRARELAGFTRRPNTKGTAMAQRFAAG
jgi:hypothetical protein